MGLSSGVGCSFAAGKRSSRQLWLERRNLYSKEQKSKSECSSIPSQTHKMFRTQNVTAGHTMSRPYTKCHSRTYNVTAVHTRSQPDTQCHSRTHNVTAGHKMSQPDTQCHSRTHCQRTSKPQCAVKLCCHKVSKVTFTLH